jgi:hypothetical protein
VVGRTVDTVCCNEAEMLLQQRETVLDRMTRLDCTGCSWADNQTDRSAVQRHNVKEPGQDLLYESHQGGSYAPSRVGSLGTRLMRSASGTVSPQVSDQSG